jgi:hypothetical protein
MCRLRTKRLKRELFVTERIEQNGDVELVVEKRSFKCGAGRNDPFRLKGRMVLQQAGQQRCQAIDRETFCEAYADGTDHRAGGILLLDALNFSHNRPDARQQ